MKILIETEDGEYVELGSLQILSEEPGKDSFYLASGYSPICFGERSVMHGRLRRLIAALRRLDGKVDAPVLVVSYEDFR